jgi:hypothetical protein
MVSYVIYTLTTVRFLLLNTPYIVEGAGTHERTLRERQKLNIFIQEVHITKNELDKIL